MNDTNTTYDGLEENVGQYRRGHAPGQLAGAVSLAQHQGTDPAAQGLQVPGLRLSSPQSRVETAPNKRQPGVDQLSGLHKRGKVHKSSNIDCNKQSRSAIFRYLVPSACTPVRAARAQYQKTSQNIKCNDAPPAGSGWCPGGVWPRARSPGGRWLRG